MRSVFCLEERDISMELLQLVEKFKDIIDVSKIEDAVDELKTKLLNDNECKKLCEDWISICPDLTKDYMQMIFQYYFADRKEKKQDYTPKVLQRQSLNYQKMKMKRYV